ncbi:MAG TPA: hypothetical protein VIX42_07345 [Edaphobacter sp.]
MNKTNHQSIKSIVALFFLVAALALSAVGQSHKPLPPLDPATNPHRTRLILKDGSYQVVMSYRVVGTVVLYISAERGGAEEEIPAALVDFDATHRWEKQHATPEAEGEGTSSQAPAIDPELLKEEADRAAYTPEVAKDLHLPEQDSVLVLDTFRGTPELVPMPQSNGDLNRNTGHNVLRSAINPLSSSHQLVQLKGEKSLVQLHVDTPVLYVRVGDAAVIPTGGAPLTVDTHGASSKMHDTPGGGSADSRYVIVRADVRTGARVVASFKIGFLGGVHQQEDVIETNIEMLPGGHWMKLMPREPLSFGEYALMEIVSEKEVNLGVWDFGIHPVAPENADAIKPEPKRPLSLERRKPD